DGDHQHVVAVQAAPHAAGAGAPNPRATLPGQCVADRSDGASDMSYTETIGSRTYRFADLKTLMAKASPLRSGDQLAGVAAASEEERVAAKMALAEVPLRTFLNEPLIPYETDEVTRLVIDDHSPQAFAEISHLTVGDFRNWLLSSTTDADAL